MEQISLITIIVPVFNGSRHLEQALDSIISQTFGEWECIIVDDGSTDQTAQIASSYADKDQRFRLLKKINGGLSSARNAGLDQTQSEFVAFLDYDDFWHPEKIGKHMAHLSKNKNLGVSYSGTQFVSEDGRLLRHRRIPKLSNLSDYYLFCRNPITNGSNAVFRKEVFDLQRFDETIPKNQDVDCWLRIAFTPPLRWKFAGIPDLLTYYRFNPNGLSHDFKGHFECAQRVLEKASIYAPEITARYGSLSQAFQLRFYARRAIASGEKKQARKLVLDALRTDWRVLFFEVPSTLVTLLLAVIPVRLAKR